MENTAHKIWSWRRGIAGAVVGLMLGGVILLIVAFFARSTDIALPTPTIGGPTSAKPPSPVAPQQPEVGGGDNAASLIQQIAGAKYRIGDVHGAACLLSKVMDKKVVLQKLEKLLNVQAYRKEPFWNQDCAASDSLQANNKASDVSGDKPEEASKAPEQTLDTGEDQYRELAKVTLAHVLIDLENGDFQSPFVAPGPTPDFPSAKPASGTRAEILFRIAATYEALQMPDEAKVAIGEAARYAAEYHRAEVIRERARHVFAAKRNAAERNANCRWLLAWWRWVLGVPAGVLYVLASLSKPIFEAFSKRTLIPRLAEFFKSLRFAFGLGKKTRDATDQPVEMDQPVEDQKTRSPKS